MTFTIGIGLTASVINPVAFTYGYERLRFPKPVFIGDTIRSRVTIASKEDDPKRKEFGRVVEKLEVLNQRDETVLACEHVLLVKKRGDWRRAIPSTPDDNFAQHVPGVISRVLLRRGHLVFPDPRPVRQASCQSVALLPARPRLTPEIFRLPPKHWTYGHPTK